MVFVGFIDISVAAMVAAEVEDNAWINLCLSAFPTGARLMKQVTCTISIFAYGSREQNIPVVPAI